MRNVETPRFLVWLTEKGSYKLKSVTSREYEVLEHIEIKTFRRCIQYRKENCVEDITQM